MFFDNYKQNKTKKILHTFVDIAKETAHGKIQRKEILPELELLDVFISLIKRQCFWKFLSEIIYIIFLCRTSIII